MMYPPFLPASYPTATRFLLEYVCITMQEELASWLNEFFNQLFGQASQPAYAVLSSSTLDTFTTPPRRTVGCQVCKKRLWTDYTGAVYSQPVNTSDPPPPLPRDGDWTHTYSKDGRLMYHDVCEACLQTLKQKEQQERAEKRNRKLAEIRRRQQTIYKLMREMQQAR